MSTVTIQIGKKKEDNSVKADDKKEADKGKKHYGPKGPNECSASTIALPGLLATTTSTSTSSENYKMSTNQNQSSRGQKRRAEDDIEDKELLGTQRAFEIFHVGIANAGKFFASPTRLFGMADANISLEALNFPTCGLQQQESFRILETYIEHYRKVQKSSRPGTSHFPLNVNEIYEQNNYCMVKCGLPVFSLDPAIIPKRATDALLEWMEKNDSHLIYLAISRLKMDYYEAGAWTVAVDDALRTVWVDIAEAMMEIATVKWRMGLLPFGSKDDYGLFDQINASPNRQDPNRLLFIR
ncbi:hypothetical protein QBC38DRAFT_459087 [Podospora fimiseda]|uniref:Uncharacterized protein n=1 Tax=Podospora fimiseda TaxID=252190 RepID=A0AAN7BI28_9PEZI|nr:hypothetical protein QBC38DRAFT_459087 [Podospora fimiseda]